MNGHCEAMTEHDPEAEQAMADLWAEWEYYHNASLDKARKAVKRAERWSIVVAAVGLVALWFIGAEILHHLLTK